MLSFLVLAVRMKGIRDWVFGQLLSKSLASTRPLSSSGGFFSEEPVNEESDDPGAYFAPWLLLLEICCFHSTSLIVFQLAFSWIITVLPSMFCLMERWFSQLGARSMSFHVEMRELLRDIRYFWQLCWGIQ